ncbi:MAG: hypothetical protein IJ268_02360 [Proteobacteria bacterium]|nr:hypothetical protein [Pseudomonadota bacterium]MBQ9243231.1 hypothetical protein [Pseudomonadota bacterium]
MDKLQVLQDAEKKGGKARRDAIEKLMIFAREKGCNIEAGGGRIGGINFRYGGIGYAIMDISTEGDVKLYAQPHPNKTAPEALSNTINKYLADNDEKLKLKSHPINCHGLLNQKVEEIERSELISFFEVALKAIKDTYYS